MWFCGLPVDGWIEMPKKEELAGNKVRVSLDLSEPFYQRLVELEKITHENKSSVIRHALQFYEYLIEMTIEGNSFKIVDQDGTERDLVFFGPYMPSSQERKIGHEHMPSSRERKGLEEHRPFSRGRKRRNRVALAGTAHLE